MPAPVSTLQKLSPYHAFRPRPDNLDERDEQSSFVNDYKSRFSVCLGGNGSGKSIAAAFKTARFVRETQPRWPYFPFWVVGETMDQIGQLGWVEKLSKFIPPEWILNIQWHQAKRKWPEAVVLRNRLEGKHNEAGWVLQFKAYTQSLDSFKALAIGGFWFNEEVPIEIVHEVRARCRETNAPGWADFTPINVKSAEWPELYEQHPDDWAWYHLNTLRNMEISEEWKKSYFGSIPTEWLNTRQFGDFSQLSGAVFPEFSKRHHVIDGFAIPEIWPRWRAIDFGFVNPFCCLWLTKDHDGRYYIYDEHYASHQLVEQHAEAINKRDWLPWYGETFSDHDAQMRSELGAHGISCTLANKEIRPSIEAIKSLLKVRGDGKPRLFIFRACANLIRELPGYRWPEGTVVRSAAEQPIDKDNHAIDALRYGIMGDWSKGEGFNPKGYKRTVDRERHGVQ